MFRRFKDDDGPAARRGGRAGADAARRAPAFSARQTRATAAAPLARPQDAAPRAPARGAQPVGDREGRQGRSPARGRDHRQRDADRRGDRAQRQGVQPPDRGAARRGARPRPARAAAQGPDDHRHPGQHARPGLRRAQRQARADPGALQGRAAPAADHRQDRLARSAAASTNRSPWVDARLADGSRVNAIIPPCALDGPLLSIRKFARDPADAWNA